MIIRIVAKGMQEGQHLLCLFMFLKILRKINHLIYIGEHGNRLEKEESPLWAFIVVIQCLLTCIAYFILGHGSRGQILWSVGCIKPWFSFQACSKEAASRASWYMTCVLWYHPFPLPPKSMCCYPAANNKNKNLIFNKHNFILFHVSKLSLDVYRTFTPLNSF